MHFRTIPSYQGLLTGVNLFHFSLPLAFCNLYALLILHMSFTFKIHCIRHRRSFHQLMLLTQPSGPPTVKPSHTVLMLPYQWVLGAYLVPPSTSLSTHVSPQLIFHVVLSWKILSLWYWVLVFSIKTKQRTRQYIFRAQVHPYSTGRPLSVPTSPQIRGYRAQSIYEEEDTEPDPSTEQRRPKTLQFEETEDPQSPIRPQSRGDREP